jgi:Fic family protein
MNKRDADRWARLTEAQIERGECVSLFDYVRDGMEALLECLAEETDAFVSAVLGHWLFSFIHPYMDGNGRMARFTMNLMLASGGYPWTVIRVEDRATYMAGLEKASVVDDLASFSNFVADSVRRSQ